MSTTKHPKFGPVSVSRYEFLEFDEQLPVESLRRQVRESLIQDKVYDVVRHIHHDDGCQERLDVRHFCFRCGFYPDTQSTMIVHCCPNCNNVVSGSGEGIFPCSSCRLMLKK